MLSRVATSFIRSGSISLRNSRLIYPSHISRRLFALPRPVQIRPWYRRFWPLTIAVSAATASIPVGYILYCDYIQNQVPDENFDENTESVSQSELDNLLNQTQNLLNSELYLNRSSSFIVPIRLFFRTLKLMIIFTPVVIFYFIQAKFAPQLFDKWCFTLKRYVHLSKTT